MQLCITLEEVKSVNQTEDIQINTRGEEEEEKFKFRSGTMTFPVKTTCSKFTEGEEHHCLVVSTERSQAELRLRALLYCTVNSIKSELNPLYIFHHREKPRFLPQPGHGLVFLDSFTRQTSQHVLVRPSCPAGSSQRHCDNR